MAPERSTSAMFFSQPKAGEEEQQWRLARLSSRAHFEMMLRRLTGNNAIYSTNINVVTLRKIFSKTGLWPITCSFDYTNQCLIGYLKKVEAHWQPILKQQFEESAKNEENQRYILSMFPYPSGSLHLGHVRIYTATDIIARYNRLCGRNVLNPMGWDSFGLPAENAAFQNNLNPRDWTYFNINQMKDQFAKVSLNFNWREATSDPSFYKWTQWLFLQFYKANLAYKSKAEVNWDPVDGTVLANEQIDEHGRSWRSGAPVEKRQLRQWFIRLTPFLKSLYDGVDVNLDKSGLNLDDVLDSQRKWIGDINTYCFYVPVGEDSLPVYCDFPELFLDPSSYLVLPNNHWLLSEAGVRIKNPFTGGFLSVRKLEDLNENEKADFSKTVRPYLVADHKLEDLSLRQQIFDSCKENRQLGGYFTSRTFHDWLVSRQRYWGTPIPIVYCSDCGIQPVPESELPVVLPEISDFKTVNTGDSREGTNRLQKVAPDSWLHCNCPKCQRPDAVRETETLDTFFDSSWYYLRYASEPCDREAYDLEKTKEPVWLYVGGEEHMRGHLLHARMVYHFLKSRQLLKSSTTEPFRALFIQKVVTGKTYKVNGKYMKNEEVQWLLKEKKLKKKDIITSYEKMSKSKGNGVDPNALVEKYGIDATRFSVIGFKSPEKERVWKGEDQEYVNVFKLIRKIILTVDQFIFMRQVQAEDPRRPVVRRFMVKKSEGESVSSTLNYISESRNKLIAQLTTVNDQIVYSANAGKILVEFMNRVMRPNVLDSSIALSLEYEKCLADFIIMLSPITPHLAEECWTGFRSYANKQLSSVYNLSGAVFDQRWPQVDSELVAANPKEAISCN